MSHTQVTLTHPMSATKIQRFGLRERLLDELASRPDVQAARGG
jgi:hypothetical protein